MRFSIRWPSSPGKMSIILLLLAATALIVPGENQVFAASGTWATKASMPTARAGLAVGVVSGILYAVGGNNPGNTLEAYDPSTDTWTTKAALPALRNFPNAEVVNGILYVVGGADGPPGWFNTVYAYNPSSDSWTSKASMPSATSTAVTGVINGKIYVAGGYAGGEVTALQVYDPVADTWTTKASLPTPVHGGAGGVVNGILYVVGGCFDGCNSSTNVLNTVEAYDPSTDTWTTKAPMPTARYNLAAGVVNGVLYAAGGFNSSNLPLGTVEAYDPSTNTWTTTTSMPTARCCLAAGVVNGVLYAVGGYNGANLSTNEAFTPVVPFAAFSAIVGINNRQKQFAVGGQFTLGAGGACCTTNPLADAVTLQIGGFSITIPAGSFHKDAHGNYVYSGTINGVTLAAAIRPQGGNKFAYGALGQGANNLPTMNPVTVGLTVGNNRGSTSVNAFFRKSTD